MEQSEARLEILKKIDEYERLGYFDRDVENDPPSRQLRRGEVDYLQKRLTTRLKSAVANHVAKKVFDGYINDGMLVIKEVRGIENYLAVADGGLIITANHFNAFDNYAVFKAIEPYLGKKNLYKIIREGNYTSFPGLYGFFFRNCNTLPLSSNFSVFKDMIRAVQTLLKRGEKILIYPEQGMWWNYRKPRPLKSGAFLFAARAGVPVLPMFITMEDTENLDGDGFPIQAYTVHILPAIYPDPDMPVRDARRVMRDENYRMWKQVYEEVYGIPLEYAQPEDGQAPSPADDGDDEE